MGVRFTLSTDLTEKEVLGKFAFLIIGAEADREKLVEAAVALKAFTTQQLEELSFHKQKMDAEGVSDKDVAASLLVLEKAAGRADVCTDAVLGFLSGLVAFGPFGKEGQIQ